MIFRAIRHVKISFTKGANPQGCFGTYNKVQFIMFIMILATVNDEGWERVDTWAI